MHISTRNWASQFNDSGERGGDSNHLAANPSRIDPEVNRILATEVVKSDDGWTVNHGRRKEGERDRERERGRSLKGDRKTMKNHRIPEVGCRGSSLFENHQKMGTNTSKRRSRSTKAFFVVECPGYLRATVLLSIPLVFGVYSCGAF